VFLAVEVSYSLHEEDIERSVERANILAYLLKKEVIPVLVSVEVKREAEKKLKGLSIHLCKFYYSLSSNKITIWL